MDLINQRLDRIEKKIDSLIAHIPEIQINGDDADEISSLFRPLYYEGPDFTLSTRTGAVMCY